MCDTLAALYTTRAQFLDTGAETYARDNRYAQDEGKP